MSTLAGLQKLPSTDSHRSDVEVSCLSKDVLGTATIALYAIDELCKHVHAVC